jgi:hypothetical protein
MVQKLVQKEYHLMFKKCLKSRCIKYKSKMKVKYPNTLNIMLFSKIKSNKVT